MCISCQKQAICYSCFDAAHRGHRIMKSSKWLRNTFYDIIESFLAFQQTYCAFANSEHVPASVKLQFGEERNDASRHRRELICALKDRNFSQLRKFDSVTTRWNTLRSLLESLRTCTDTDRSKELAQQYREVIIQLPYPDLSSDGSSNTRGKEADTPL